MLADEGRKSHIGTLGEGVQQPHEQLIALTEFVAAQLPFWRNRSNREGDNGEDKLTFQLCLSLNVATRQSVTWCHIHFAPQSPTEPDARRRIDITVHTLEPEVIFAGRWYNLEEPILPIECKRLPTPGPKSKRDHREYVYSGKDSSGGMQRFKTGAHGANHRFAAMIGYVQKNDCPHWLGVVNGWVSDLAASGIEDWSQEDSLHMVSVDAAARTAVHSSTHRRSNGDPITLRHLWVLMC